MIDWIEASKRFVYYIVSKGVCILQYDRTIGCTIVIVRYHHNVYCPAKKSTHASKRESEREKCRKKKVIKEVRE